MHGKHLEVQYKHLEGWHSSETAFFLPPSATATNCMRDLFLYFCTFSFTTRYKTAVKAANNWLIWLCMWVSANTVAKQLKQLNCIMNKFSICVWLIDMQHFIPRSNTWSSVEAHSLIDVFNICVVSSGILSASFPVSSPHAVRALNFH